LAESVHSWNPNPGVSNLKTHKTILPRRESWVGLVTTPGERGVACMDWVWEPEQRPLGRLRCTWKDNIKIGIKSTVTAYTGIALLRMEADGGGGPSSTIKWGEFID
jgi:hypothetical protein